MPAKKGRLKELEKRNADLVKTVEFQLKKITKLENWLKEAFPVVWIQVEDIQKAYDWEKGREKLLSEKEVIGNDGE